jgi:hypothetical protein
VHHRQHDPQLLAVAPRHPAHRLAEIEQQVVRQPDRLAEAGHRP